MDGQVLGGCICMCGSTLAIVGMNMQRWSLLRVEEERAAAELAQRQDEEDDEGAREKWKLTRGGENASPPASPSPEASGGAAADGGDGRWSGTCWWAVSLLVYIVGQLTQMAGLAFASQTLVSALSNISLVTNVCVAHCWFGEPFAACPPPATSATAATGCCDSARRLWRRLMGWDLAAMAILGAGSTVVVLFAPMEEQPQYTVLKLEELFFTPVYFVFFICSLAAAVATLSWVYCVTRRSHRREDGSSHDNIAARRREGLLYAVATAVTGSITITLSKITMLLIRTSIENPDENQLREPVSWCFIAGLVCCAVLNLKVLNDGLGRHEATRIIPTMYVMHTVLTIVGGQLLYQTYLDLEMATGLCFGAGVVVSILGVYLLAQAPPSDAEDDEDYEMLGEQFEQDGRNGRADTTPLRGMLQVEVSQLVPEEFEEEELVFNDEHSPGGQLPEALVERPGSAPRLTTMVAETTSGPYVEQASPGPADDSPSASEERGRPTGRRQHRRMRSYSSSPADRRWEMFEQGRSPGLDVGYVIASQPHQGRLGRTRASPAAVDFSLWSAARIIPGSAGVRRRGASMLERSLADAREQEEGPVPTRRLFGAAGGGRSNGRQEDESVEDVLEV